MTPRFLTYQEVCLLARAGKKRKLLPSEVDVATVKATRPKKKRRKR